MRLPAVFVLLLVGAFPALASGVWNYRHEVFFPEEERDRLRLYGFAGASGVLERKPEGEGSGWRTRFTERAASGIWAAGTLFDRLAYFAEGLAFYDPAKLALGQARADLRVHPRALSLRAGRFLFPFGIEARGAPHRVNRFVLRPPLRSGPNEGIALFGDLVGGALNVAAGILEGFPAALADTLLGPLGGTSGEAVGGRVGLSPTPGVEIGGSYAEEDGAARARILGLDFSVSGGPLFLAAEWGRLRRDGEEEAAIDLAYGRLAYRIVEYSERFDAIEILGGADLIDPSENPSGERRVDILGGILVSPRSWIVLKAEYRSADREGDREGSFFAEALLVR
ncbi:MAG: hypothetical protein FJY73_05830 [Candidatus Eisenbacteria bacterium]|nr:hypothetical protein [Candidatus Eisenbacteria bacterium]